MFCPNCGTQSLVPEKFCASCGTQLPAAAGAAGAPAATAAGAVGKSAVVPKLVALGIVIAIAIGGGIYLGLQIAPKSTGIATPDPRSSTAPTPTPTAAPTSTPTPTPTAVPTPTPTPRPSFLTGAYGSAEEAIRAWLLANGFTYSGDCTTGTRDSGTYCSSLYQNVSGGGIFMSGPIDSEPAYWLRLLDFAEGWYVADVATIGSTTAPPAGWL